MATFLEQARTGTVDADAVDDFVARWHEGEGETTLRQFLGLTEEEYRRWLLEPAALDELIGGGQAPRARHKAAV